MNPHAVSEFHLFPDDGARVDDAVPSNPSPGTDDASRVERRARADYRAGANHRAGADVGRSVDHRALGDTRTRIHTGDGAPIARHPFERGCEVELGMLTAQRRPLTDVDSLRRDHRRARTGRQGLEKIRCPREDEVAGAGTHHRRHTGDARVRVALHSAIDLAGDLAEGGLGNLNH